jgi:hypothetical protein
MRNRRAGLEIVIIDCRIKFSLGLRQPDYPHPRALCFASSLANTSS